MYNVIRKVSPYNNIYRYEMKLIYSFKQNNNSFLPLSTIENQFKNHFYLFLKKISSLKIKKSFNESNSISRNCFINLFARAQFNS